MRRVADENFNNAILGALFRRNASLNIARAQDVGFAGVTDQELLAWASNAERVLLTHDVTTITVCAYDRVTQGRRMPGVFEVSRNVSISTAVEDILLIDECSEAGEWEGQVRYLPLRRRS